jgi:hypothetical protein
MFVLLANIRVYTLAVNIEGKLSSCVLQLAWRRRRDIFTPRAFRHAPSLTLFPILKPATPSRDKAAAFVESECPMTHWHLRIHPSFPSSPWALVHQKWYGSFQGLVIGPFVLSYSSRHRLMDSVTHARNTSRSRPNRERITKHSCGTKS